MLVLSRGKDQVITIGDNIRITITDIRGDKVRVGIDAPKDVPVHRLEVYEAIQRDARGEWKTTSLAPGDCLCSRCVESKRVEAAAKGEFLLIPFAGCRCGNKRCPKAVDHRFRCTNSNEVGQIGVPEDLN